jgi:uncharacterized protein DUF3632
MTSEGVISGGSIFGIWELRTALEREHAAKAIANCAVSAASQWIIRSGMRLYREMLDATPLDESETRGGPLYNGEVGLCRERWQFWKLRFSKVKDEVDEEVAEMVQQAVSEMERVESKYW